jgi:hypothetical protein
MARVKYRAVCAKSANADLDHDTAFHSIQKCNENNYIISESPLCPSASMWTPRTRSRTWRTSATSHVAATCSRPAGKVARPPCLVSVPRGPHNLQMHSVVGTSHDLTLGTSNHDRG